MKLTTNGWWFAAGLTGLLSVAQAHAEEMNCHDLVYVPATVVSVGTASCVAEDDGFTISIPLPGGAISISFGGSTIAATCAASIEEIPAHYERIEGEFEVQRTSASKTVHLYEGCETGGNALTCKYKVFSVSMVDWVLGDRCVAEESEYPHPEGL